MIPVVARFLAKPVAVRAVSFLRAIPPWVWLSIAACVVLLALRWHWIGVGEDRTQVKWDEAERKHALVYAEQRLAAQAIEARHRADFAAAVARLNLENSDALAAHNRLVADLRAGNVRLRDRFSCPSSRLSPATAGAEGSAGADETGFNVADASVAFGIARDGDRAIRQLTACQAILKANGLAAEQ